MRFIIKCDAEVLNPARLLSSGIPSFGILLEVGSLGRDHREGIIITPQRLIAVSVGFFFFF